MTSTIRNLFAQLETVVRAPARAPVKHGPPSFGQEIVRGFGLLTLVWLIIFIVTAKPSVSSKPNSIPNYSPSLVVSKMSAEEQLQREHVALARQAQFIQSAQATIAVILFDGKEVPTRNMLLAGLGILLILGASLGIRNLVGITGVFLVAFTLL